MDIGLISINESTIKSIAIHCSKLTSLQIGGNEFSVTNNDLWVIGCYSLIRNDITSSMIELANNCINLEILHLDECFITDNGNE